jgi:hypothetical protein
MIGRAVVICGEQRRCLIDLHAAYRIRYRRAGVTAGIAGVIVDHIRCRIVVMVMGVV